MAKLNQIIAVEKEVKGRVYGGVTELHKWSQKSELFSGFTKTYKKKDEDGEDYPSEKKKVQAIAGNLLLDLQKSLIELFDVVATKDSANMKAVATVEFADGTKLENVPVQYLIFLEKQLIDIRKFVDTLPVLDDAEDWIIDPNSTGIYKTAPIVTHRTKKREKPIVLYPATEQHPAQTQMVSEDIVVGYWEQVRLSSALSMPIKNAILNRVEDAIISIKQAREAANMVEAPRVNFGAKLLNYLFA